MTNSSVTFLSALNPNRLEKTYLKSRKIEGWYYDDETVRELPYSGFPPEQAKIWGWRRRSLARLVRHLSKVFGRDKFTVLDVGCGNGWMSNFIASKFKVARVLGVDVNLAELEQANRVFANPALEFGYANILSEDLPAESFDVIILAGSAQYFPDLHKLQDSLRRLLTPRGEAHIIDTNFYSDIQAQQSAKLKSEEYFNNQKNPEMIPFYHHHLYSDWQGFDLNTSWTFRILQKLGILSPFPWLVLKSQ